MNALHHATQPKIQKHFKVLKTSVNTKNVKHIDHKTHTHTLNKFNQFYISKTSYDSLMSIL